MLLLLNTYAESALLIHVQSVPIQADKQMNAM